MTKLNNKKTLRLSKLFLYVGLFGNVFFAVLWFVSVRTEGMDILFHIIYGFFELIGLILMMSYLIYSITYDDNEFTVRNILGIKHTYRYDQVTGIEIEKGKQTKLVIGKKKYVIDFFHIGTRVSVGEAITGDSWELQNYAFQSLKQRYGNEYKKYIKYITKTSYSKR